MGRLRIHPFLGLARRPLTIARILLLTLTSLLLVRQDTWYTTPSRPGAAPDFGKLPLSFIPVGDSSRSEARFQARGAGGNLFFTPREVVLALPAASGEQRPSSLSGASDRRLLTGQPSASVLSIRFEGANS